MVAGGTGITPMYQIIQSVEDDPKDLTSLSLVSFNQSPSDSVLDDDFIRQDELGVLSYLPIVENPDDMWLHGEGRVSKKFLELTMPPPYLDDSHVLLCGPRELVTSAQGILTELGYRDDQVSTF